MLSLLKLILKLETKMKRHRSITLAQHYLDALTTYREVDHRVLSNFSVYSIYCTEQTREFFFLRRRLSKNFTLILSSISLLFQDANIFPKGRNCYTYNQKGSFFFSRIPHFMYFLRS